VDGSEVSPAPNRAGAGDASEQSEEAAPTDAPAGPRPSPGPPTGDQATDGAATGDEAASDQTPSDEDTGDEVASDQTPSDEDTGDEAASDQTPSDEHTGDEAASDQTPSDEDTGDEAASDEAVEEPPIFDLPDRRAGGRPPDDKAPGNGGDSDAEGPRGSGERTLVLGGAAAAEGRTTGPTPRIGGPMPAEARSTPAVNGGHDGPDEETAVGRHLRSAGGGPPRWALVLAAIPVFALVLLLCAWAIDTAALSGQVRRNVEVAGRPVGGLGEASLPEVMNKIAEEVAARPVRVTSGDKTYETAAGEIGLALDEQATSEAALDVGRGDSLFKQPFAWLRSFFTPRDVDVRYTVSGPTATAKMVELQGADLTAPRDATIKLGAQGWALVPGVPGQGVDMETLIDELPDAAAESRAGPIEVEVGTAPLIPTITDEQAQKLADQANQMTADGLELTAGESTITVPADRLRGWIGPTLDGGELKLAINATAVKQALPEVFEDITADAKDARIVLGANGPTVVPSQQGVACCGADSAARVWNALTKDQPGTELEVAVTDPALTTEAAQGLGVKQPVCGNNAWRDAQPTTAGPGFTTYYNPGEPRVSNIHRIADIVDGTLVLPGHEFSMNDRVGPRTLEKGFVVAGAIRDGKHVDEVGGGVSQFATTTFNAAYFCGLDITSYQSHSEYFTRYPRGREATMGYPNPDLSFINDTPYGILIDTSYTDTSVTVTMWSTPYARGEQVGISESPSGQCTVVTTTRRITYPDRPPATDTFTATYRPGPDKPC
jgi:vancomycin resistance protein YoaR